MIDTGSRSIIIFSECSSKIFEDLRCNFGSRTIFWWGHDTEEDKEHRKLMETRKGLIKWSDPKSDLEAKKEYVWAPARSEM